MSDAEIASIVSRQKSAEELARDLVARAVEIDGGDNATSQVIRVCSVERTSMPRGRPYRLAS
jgi:serine/threonine protein phosphatase PrpC